MRLLDWRERLQAVLHDAEKQPFIWGTYDCFSGLTSRCVEAIIGEDIAASIRGQYTTALGAMKLIRAHGFADLIEALESRFISCAPAFAHHGDIVCMKGDETGFATGILLGERIAVMHLKGLATIDRFEALQAFKVE